jgi:hypothetical protein
MNITQGRGARIAPIFGECPNHAVPDDDSASEDPRTRPVARLGGECHFDAPHQTHVFCLEHAQPVAMANTGRIS